MGLGYEVHPQRVQHFHDDAKFWFGVAAQRSIKVLTGKSGFFGNSAHAYRARHRSDCHRDFGCVVGLKSFCEIGRYHFWAIEVFSRIKWSSFCHCLVLKHHAGQNRLSCSPRPFGRAKWSVVSFERRLLSPSFSHAISNRRPIIQAIGPVPFIRVPHFES